MSNTANNTAQIDAQIEYLDEKIAEMQRKEDELAMLQSFFHNRAANAETDEAFDRDSAKADRYAEELDDMLGAIS